MNRSENTAEGTMTVIPLPFSPLSLSPKKLVSELKELRGEVEEWGGGAEGISCGRTLYWWRV